jgi:Mg2+ and Co2+ transporter CorA
VAYFIIQSISESSSSMAEQIEHRVIKLELKVEDHADELKKLQDISTDLRNSLTGIENTLNQIKYLAMGAVVVVLAQSMGITNVLKMFVGM